MKMQSRWLSCHASYRCRHAGACCTAGWPIPVEADRLQIIQAAIAAGTLRRPAADSPAFSFPSAAPPATPALLGMHSTRCVFYGPAAGGSCDIHRTLGHSALPLACRQFPRISVLDPRGASVTLSHYCPTAASLLEHAGRVAILADPIDAPPGAEYVGLDARDALPPLVRADMLMDWQSWWALEARAVDLLANGEGPAGQALGRLAAIVDRLQSWRPDQGPLMDGITEAFQSDAAFEGDRMPDATRDARLAAVFASIPADLRPAVNPKPYAAPPEDAVLRRFLASHAFANWIAHLGDGLHVWIKSIEAAFALVTSGWSIRESDLLLRHLADPNALADRL
jgi:Fe-S-cluster containining protein